MLEIDYKKTADDIVNFLKEEFKKRGKTKAILGLSGGLDSSVCAILCQKAGLDLYGIILPCKKSGLVDSKKIVEFLKLKKDRVMLLDIGKTVDALAKDLKKIIKLDKVDLGNLAARQRMVAQYAIARRQNGLVLGTEDLSEYYLGYFTLHGDQACDISPISSLFKSQLFGLAKYLGAPKWLLQKKPSPNLWEGQTAEKELGFSYEDADPIIFLHCCQGIGKEEIVRRGFDEKLVGKIIERIESTDYKRQNCPKF